MDFRVWLRSVAGQLTLFGIVFVGAVVVALLPWFLRSRIFEYYSREGYPKIESKSLADEGLELLTSRRANQEKIEDLFDRIRKKDEIPPDRSKAPWHNLEGMYGKWFDPEEPPEGDLMARRLTGSGRRWLREWVIERLRRTLAAGNLHQRERAVDWIDAALGDETARKEAGEELEGLLEFARERARRRGEDDLYRKADAVLRKGR